MSDLLSFARVETAAADPLQHVVRNRESFTRGAPADLGEASEQFEALLLGQFLRAANQPLFEDTPLGGSREERAYRERFYEEVAKLAAERGGIGIAASLTGGERAAEGQGE